MPNDEIKVMGNTTVTAAIVMNRSIAPTNMVCLSKITDIKRIPTEEEPLV
jgi:hypothetical protein